MLIPENLRWMLTADAPRRDWIASLPALVTDLAGRWSLRLGDPYRPGGSSAWVAPATRANGSRAVLKVGMLHYEALHEAEGLRFWSGHGAVQLLQSEQYGQTTALLLEQCLPGTMLSKALPPQKRDEVIAALLPRLWTTPVDGHPFRPLQSMTDAWADSYESSGHKAPDPALAEVALTMWRELPTSTPREVLLCTDLHPDNVLSAEREPWLMVDPKPYVGDPSYDPIQHMLNFPARLQADPTAFATRMATLLDLDPTRVRHYLFARCILESRKTPSFWPIAKATAP